jgi:uncharacterized protein YfaQ (DUF2300 family)
MKQNKQRLAQLDRERAEAVAAYAEAERAYRAAVAVLPERAALEEARIRRDTACVRYIAHVARHGVTAESARS